jgi:large subunit ribosomal protein L23
MPSESRANRGGGPKLEPYQILVRPLVTEKSMHQANHRKAFPFVVNPWATKEEIKSAVEELFPEVRVKKVRTANRSGKKRRFRFRMGQLANWKKAIVTVHEDSPPIPVF